MRQLRIGGGLEGGQRHRTARQIRRSAESGPHRQLRARAATHHRSRVGDGTQTAQNAVRVLFGAAARRLRLCRRRALLLRGVNAFMNQDRLSVAGQHVAGEKDLRPNGERRGSQARRHQLYQLAGHRVNAGQRRSGSQLGQLARRHRIGLPIERRVERLTPDLFGQRRAEIAHQLHEGAAALGRRDAVAQKGRDGERIGAMVEEIIPNGTRRAGGELLKLVIAPFAALGCRPSRCRYFMVK